MKLCLYLIGGILMTCSQALTAATPSFADFSQRAEKGERLCVAFLGGSLTWGARASDPQKTSYRALTGQRLREKYPKAHFTFVDAAIGGSGAQLGAFRLDRDVLAARPDLVFLDFTLNDGVDKVSPDTLAAHEAIVRRLINEARCPVIQMFLAAKKMVSDGTTEKMTRYQEHRKMAEAYSMPCGDAIVLMQQKYQAGELDLDTVWRPEYFDTCHPCDEGYKLYAEAAWAAYTAAVRDRLVCRVPKTMLFGDTYMQVARVRLSELAPLPKGWRSTLPETSYSAFDFLMTRWLDDVTIASNFLPAGRKTTTPMPAAEPLALTFTGSSVLFFGESSPTSGKCQVIIDGAEKVINTCQLGPTGKGRMWVMVAEGLDSQKEHTLDIIPLFEAPETPQQICIESICIAGANPSLRKREQ